MRLEQKLDADVMAIFGPVVSGAEHKVRSAIEASGVRHSKIAVVLHTAGGVVEIAERMVNVIRHHYGEVIFIVPDVAMSAGTVFAMSGDAIMMDYFSCLGPIDPQLPKDGKLVPALSYLVQFKRLMDRAASGQLTSAEFALLNKLDLAELHQFEEARSLSWSLLEKWLVNYKFKDWTHRESSKKPVTMQDKQERAKEIAKRLSDNEHWHSHGRGISMKVLREELKLKVDDFGADKALADVIHRYESLIKDYRPSTASLTSSTLDSSSEVLQCDKKTESGSSLQIRRSIGYRWRNWRSNYWHLRLPAQRRAGQPIPWSRGSGIALLVPIKMWICAAIRSYCRFRRNPDALTASGLAK